jgi:ABC-type branched-subunit amino acid transport system substrate-binding protein
MGEPFLPAAELGSSDADIALPPSRDKKTEGGLGRRRVMAVAIALILIAAAVVTIALMGETPESVKIGVIIPLEEGPTSHSDEVIHAVEMAMGELNAWGGIGDTRLEMVAVEVPANSESIVAAFEEMEAEHHPLAYITVSCSFLGTMAPLAEELAVPLIGLSSYPGATEGYQFTYRYNIPPEVEVGSAMSVLDYLDVDSVGILYSDSPHGCSVFEQFIDAFAEVGGTVQSQSCAADETDFSDEVANLTGLEAIFAVSTCTSLSTMFEAIQDSGYGGYVLGSSCASSTFMWTLDAADGVYVSAPLLYKQENIFASSFTEEFHQEYGISVTHHGAVVYDIVHLVHDLLEGREISRGSLESELSQGFIFTGVMGGFVIPPGGHDIAFNVYPARIVEGELLYL